MTRTKQTSDADIIDLSRACARLLEEKKASEVVFLDLREVNSYLDYFIIATANSHIHCRALSRELEKFIHARGLRQRNRPDYDSGWVLLDFNELIVHIFTREMRDYYQLEKLWGDARKITHEDGGQYGAKK